MIKKIFDLLKFVWSHPLNKKSRVASLWRIISLQIASRLINNSIMLPFVNGSYLLTNHGMTGATGDWYCGLREYEDMSFILHVLKSGDLFIDVGANIGSYSILAGTCKNVEIIAFEPAPKTFFWLQKNIKINALENKVTAMNYGLAEKKKKIKFSANLDILNHALTDDEKNLPFLEIDVLKLDDVLKDKCPTVIKLDAEGYETNILKGATNILNNPSLIAIIVELNGSGERYGIKDTEIHELLKNKGFNSYQYNPSKYELKSLEDKFNEISNTLYLRKLDEINNRISRKISFTLGTSKKI